MDFRSPQNCQPYIEIIKNFRIMVSIAILLWMVVVLLLTLYFETNRIFVNIQILPAGKKKQSNGKM